MTKKQLINQCQGYLTDFLRKNHYLDYEEFLEYLKNLNTDNLSLKELSIEALDTFAIRNRSITIRNIDSELSCSPTVGKNLLKKEWVFEGYLDIEIQDSDTFLNKVGPLKSQGLTIFDNSGRLLLNNIKTKDNISIFSNYDSKDSVNLLEKSMRSDILPGISFIRCSAGEINVEDIFENNEKSKFILSHYLNNNETTGDLIFRKIYNIKKFIIEGGKEINSIVIEDLKTSSDENNHFQLSNFYVKKLELSNILNLYNNFSLINIKVDNLIIRNSDLGRMRFNSVNIGKLTLENATLNDCIFNGVIFDSYELGNEIDGKQILPEKVKDNYRQLKFVMDKNGNYTEANKFYALEMDTYSKVLNIDKKKITLKRILNNLFFGKDVKNLGDKIILEIGFLINEFGTNWIRNFFVIYLFLIVSYLFVFATGILEHALLASLTKNGFFPKVNEAKDFLGLINVSSDIMTILLFFGMERYFGNFFNNITKKIKFSLPVFITFSLFIIIPGVIFSLTKNSTYWGDFHGFETFAMLLNPLSGFDLNDAKEVVWTNQIGFIIYKVIYGFLIYQLLVSLRRTTKR